LASLWRIDDRSTALFIGEFYRQLANAKVTKAEALRRAQITLMKQHPDYSRPVYWAPYVLVGNWL
jgi:CHAT domain-containing protein